MSVTAPERLSDIIGSIYDCVLAPDRWPSALAAIVEDLGLSISDPSVLAVPRAAGGDGQNS